MNKSGDLGNPLGQLTSVPKKTAEQLVKEPLEIVEEAGVQAGAKPTTSSTTPQDNKSGSTSTSNKDTQEVVKKMYEQSDIKVNIPSDQIISELIKENPKKTPDEIQKMAATRQQLWQQQHKDTYFEPTFNPLKKPPEERPAEKVTREQGEKEKKEMGELKVEEKKKEELAPSVKQGTNEKIPGISG